ncbi:unnamed protein product [Schistosoma mattheei]|uniref:Uncharacterized protein n=1 Tax=Schistosoma mattheei TaxID=31246 RepID=A0A3P8FKX4_9TREM|nr:unnamed protein product [Schistosoma mattheei]
MTPETSSYSLKHIVVDYVLVAIDYEWIEYLDRMDL